MLQSTYWSLDYTEDYSGKHVISSQVYNTLLSVHHEKSNEQCKRAAKHMIITHTQITQLMITICRDDNVLLYVHGLGIKKEVDCLACGL